MLFTVMQIDDGHGGPGWGKGTGKPKLIEAKSVGELNAKIADEDVEPFEVSKEPAVYLLQSPPDVFLAVQMKE